ncbi:MAG: hypothetical protein ACREA4_10545 [Nitrososphaera sp.]
MNDSRSYVSFFGPSGGPSFDKKKYEHLTLSIRQTVLEKAHNRCHKCSVKFSPSVQPQFEHINGSLKDNRPANLRALCPDCFKPVEKKEQPKKGMMNNIGKVFRKLPLDLSK